MTEVDVGLEIATDCNEFECTHRCCRCDERSRYTKDILDYIGMLTQNTTELNTMLTNRNKNIMDFETLVKTRYYLHVIKEIAYFAEKYTLRLERELIEYEKYERFEYGE